MLYKYSHTVGDLLILAFFVPHNALEVHPSCVYQKSLSLHCRVVPMVCVVGLTTCSSAGHLGYKVPCYSSLYLPAESPSGARNPPRLLIMPGLLRPTREGV